MSPKTEEKREISPVEPEKLEKSKKKGKKKTTDESKPKKKTKKKTPENSQLALEQFLGGPVSVQNSVDYDPL